MTLPAPQTLATTAKRASGYLIVLLLEALLTLWLSHADGLVRLIPSLIYLYLLIVALGAIVWTRAHGIVAAAAAILMQDIWVYEPHGQLAVSAAQRLHLGVFGAIALALALAEGFSTEERRKLKLQCEVYASVTRTLQRALMPQLRDLPGYDLAYLYEPASRDTSVGGDFLDVFRLHDNRIGLLVGDLTGHGVDVAVRTVQLRYMLETCALHGQSPPETLRFVNRLIYNDDQFPELATVFMAILDTQRGVLSCSSAGHLPLLIWRSSTSSIETFESTGPILGAICSHNVGYSGFDIRMEPGDVLLAYTDGITEARYGEDLFGEDRLKALLWSLVGLPGSEAVPAIYDCVRNFARGDLRDDAALIWLGKPPAP